MPAPEAASAAGSADTHNRKQTSAVGVIMQQTVQPHGTWSSPITAEVLLGGTLGLGFPQSNGATIFWLESRPHEGGRTVVMRLGADNQPIDCMPQPFNARSRVHEYGGSCYVVTPDVLYFTNFQDQRIYQVNLHTEDARPQPVTPADGRRWADLILDAEHHRLIAVGEQDRAGGEPRNFLAAIDLHGPAADTSVRELVQGHDFFACPRLSADGRQLCWLSWDHPRMPWDGTDLQVAEVRPSGALGPVRHVAGGAEESIFQPEWTADGDLIYVSDRSGWWNLYRDDPAGPQPLYPAAHEFGLPLWQFGMRTWASLPDGRLACSWQTEAGDQLGLLHPNTGEMESIELEWTQLGGLIRHRDQLVFIGGAPDRFAELVRLDPRTATATVLRRSADLPLQPVDLSRPEPIRFATGDGEVAHGYFYPPAHASITGPANERPPLLVMSHGGPTAATSPVLNLKIQYWTSRGFAVLDVNYRGSTGYGRAYRDRLKGGWGIVDVEDCVCGARALVERDRVDSERLAIRGSSAGGFTTLAALTFHDVFRAGASLYGIGDLEALAQDTHKFEARYLDSLVGPWPEAAERYRARSPIHHVDQLACPVIFLQGQEDRIVPPAQAERMVSALQERGLPVAYLAFEGEQHGFRQAQTIRRALEAELYFYGRVFGFRPADAIEPVPIHNLQD